MRHTFFLSGVSLPRGSPISLPPVSVSPCLPVSPFVCLDPVGLDRDSEMHSQTAVAIPGYTAEATLTWRHPHARQHRASQYWGRLVQTDEVKSRRTGCRQRWTSYRDGCRQRWPASREIRVQTKCYRQTCLSIPCYIMLYPFYIDVL